MRKKSLYLSKLSTALTALLFTTILFVNSCDLPEGPYAGTRTGSTAESGPETGGPRMGTLTLILPGASRYVLEDGVIDGLKYTVTATDDAGGTVTVEAEGSSATLSLEEGEWDIGVDAYNSDGILVGSGSLAAITIVPGTNPAQTVRMTVDLDYEAELLDIYIRTEADLRRIGAEENGLAMDDPLRIFHLAGDIVLNEAWTPIGDDGAPFKAKFNGNGKTITVKSFSAAKPKEDGAAAYLGFFAYTDGAEIENVIIKYSLVDPDSVVDISTSAGTPYNDSYAGGVTGYANNTSFKEITVTGNFSARSNASNAFHVGGIAGSAKDVTITGCQVTGSTVGGNSVSDLAIGGIAGMISNSSASGGPIISRSSFVGTITGKITAGSGNRNIKAGGIAGSLEDVEITLSFAEVNSIKAEANGASDVGGIAGFTKGAGSKINKSYAMSINAIESIGTQDSTAGGIAGKSDGTLIENCYAGIRVSSSSTAAERAGGIAGSNGGTISKCYAAGTVQSKGSNPTTYIGGIAGTGGTVSDCMALVEELDGGPSTSTKTVYRIGSPTSLTGNYARNDMVIKNRDNSDDWGITNKDGQLTPLASFRSAALYTGAVWNFTAVTGDWRFLPTGSDYNYPVLSWQTDAPGVALGEANKVDFEIDIQWP